MPRGTKMSLGEFVGPAKGGGALPTAPRERGPEDDGSFQRYPKRGEREPREHTRSEQDSTWRRGGAEDDRNRGGNHSRGGGGEGNFRSSDNNNYNNERGGDDRGGSWRDGGDRQDRGTGRSWRGGDSTTAAVARANGDAPSSGERPRLQLKQKTVPREQQQDNNEAVVVAAMIEKLDIQQDSNEKNTSEKESTPAPTTPDQESEELVANSRAGRFSAGNSSNRRDNHRERGPLPVRNNRFDQVAGDEREQRKSSEGDGRRDNRSPLPVTNTRFPASADRPNRDGDRRRDDRGPSSLADDSGRSNRDNFRRDDRGPPQVANSRFAAAAESDRSSRDDHRRDDRGPPQVTNSRFSAAADSDRSSRDEKGPPPVANSRFAAAAESDRSNRDERGPPPVTNSRFAAAAESDRSNREDFRRDERGPPPVTNSRFAAAAAMAEEENTQRDHRRSERNDDRGGSDRFDRGGPPLAQSSRFAAAAMADSDYVDREVRDRRQTDRQNERVEGGGREDRGFGGHHDERGFSGPRGDRRGPRDSAPEPEMDYFEKKKDKSKVDALLKPKVPPPEDNILKVPVKLAPEHDSNMLKMPTKAISEKQQQIPNVKKEEKEAAAPIATALSSKNSEEALNEFIIGNKQGAELKSWCEEQRAALPPVERLLFHLLTQKEKLNPDVNCAWAEPSKYGEAFLSMIDEDLDGQMQILWGIQKYCDSLGFPKLNEEYVVQGMFRAMYKYDLASDDAFQAWKEDESDEHEKGKMTAIIQTVEWFIWLDQEDEEDDEEEEVEEE